MPLPAFLLLLLVSLLPATVQADVVVLKDGSVIHGTVRKLERGRLHVKTQAMGVVKVKRQFVAKLETERPLTVELDSGERLTGRLRTEGDLLVVEGEEVEKVARIAVEAIDKAQLRALDRLDLRASGGLNLVGGNDETISLRLDGSAAYNYLRDARTKAKVTTTLNEKNDGEQTRRTTLELEHEERELFGRFSLAGSARLEENEASELDLRTILAGTLGFRLFKTPRNDFEVFAGISWLDEDFAGIESEQHFEATYGVDYRLRFDRTRFDGLLVVIPAGEDRDLVQFDANLRIELLTNLDFDVTYYDRYDSAPPAATEKRDWGLTLGLGWSN